MNEREALEFALNAINTVDGQNVERLLKAGRVLPTVRNNALIEKLRAARLEAEDARAWIKKRLAELERERR